MQQRTPSKSTQTGSTPMGALTLIGLGLVGGISVAALQGCDPESLKEPCGPCGSIASGQLSISGNAQVDGFFTAVSDFTKATAEIQGSFEADVRALGQLYGMAEGSIDAAFITELKGRIQGDFMANVEGGIRLKYKPPRCEASVNVALEAQASCEVNADCEATVDPGMASVSCEGKCEGSCSGTCMGEVKCVAPSAGISCEGECEGSCQLDVAAGCDGTCHGECSAGCELTDANGQCQGRCAGDCTGTCELDARAECGGTCHGTCYAMADPGGCEGGVQCNAECMGECSGSCQGSFEPPMASASCEASADCQAQAKAQAEANIECSPPSLDWEFAFKAGVSADAQASFVARLGELRVRGAAILRGLAKAQALINGEIDGEVVFNPSPLANLTAKIGGFASAGISGELDIPPARLTCVVPAFQEAVTLLADAGTEFTASLALQADLGASLLSPM